MKLFIFMSKVNMGTLPSTQNTFSVLLDSFCAVTAMITKCDKSQNATARIPELSQFVTVAFCDGSKHNCSDRFHSNRGCTPKCRKHVHIKIGPFQQGFLGTSIMSFITDKHTHKHIYQWNNTKMGKNTTFHIHVKSEPGFSPKYPEHVFSVIGLILCRLGHDHKMRQITKCDNWGILAVAFCDLSHFVIMAVTAQTESNNTENVFWVLGRVPMFTFDMNMKSFIFAHFGVISLLYLFVCMYISYKAHNRFTKEALLIVSDVDVYMFPVLRSIPSCTTDMNLRSCILNRHKMRQSQIATIQESLPSHFVICRSLWSWPWQHKLRPITLKTCSGYLGEYPCSLLT